MQSHAINFTNVTSLRCIKMHVHQTCNFMRSKLSGYEIAQNGMIADKKKLKMKRLFPFYTQLYLFVRYLENK